MSKGLVKLTASRQLADQIHHRIRKGAWAFGSTLPTMRELAAEYRMSLSTVQKALRELHDRDAIKLRGRQGGIVIDGEAAKATRNQIGLLAVLDPASRHSSWWSDRIVQAAQIAFAKSGYQITVFHVWRDRPDPVGQAIAALSASAHLLAGAMFFPSPASHRIAEYLDEVSLPWMSINPVDLHVRHNFVMADHIEAGRTVGECFVHLGYERVAVLYDELENASPLEKVTGLYQGYLKNNRSPAGIELVQCPDMEEQSGYDAMRQHLKTHKPPQGIFSTADTLAVGAMRACQEIGLRVPQDLGVVGSTGLPTSELRSDPPLTELRQPVEELGRQLAMCLMEMIRGGVQRISGRRIPSPLVVKESLPLTEEIRRELKLDAPVNIEEMVRHDPYGSAVEEPAVLEAVASSSFGVNSEV